MKIERIVFMQGDDANDALDILDNQGREAVIEYLKQWHYPNESETFTELSHGSNDRTFKTADNYVLTYNLGLGYIGLEYIKEL